MADEAEAFSLRPLRDGDTFTGLRHGAQPFAPLATFAKRSAQKYRTENLAQTYVVQPVGGGRIVAYITLVCSEVSTEQDTPLVQADGLHFPYSTYPAVKIARLLVDERMQRGGRGLGRALVNFALGLARDVICPAVGCRFVVVDSKRESVDFYSKCGFTIVNTPMNRERAEPVMFIDLHKATS